MTKSKAVKKSKLGGKKLEKKSTLNRTLQPIAPLNRFTPGGH